MSLRTLSRYLWFFDVVIVIIIVRIVLIVLIVILVEGRHRRRSLDVSVRKDLSRGAHGLGVRREKNVELGKVPRMHFS